MSSNVGPSTQETLDKMREELGAEFGRAVRRNDRPRLSRKLSALAAVGACALGGTGFAVASAADDDPFSNEPPPSLTAIGHSSGQAVQLRCDAERQWFADNVGFDNPALSDPRSEIPTLPTELCE